MQIDGKMIARDIEERIARNLEREKETPTLAIVVVGDDPVIENFVRIKKRMGERLKIPVVERRFDASISGEELKDAVIELGKNDEFDGIIVQLPLPPALDTQAILDAVPVAKDVDMLSRGSVALFARGEAKILPPVAGAIQEILERAGVSVSGKDALVIGFGKLVGVPASILLKHNDAHVTVIDREISDLGTYVREAKIIVSGVGKPGLLTPDMLSPDCVLIDAGTSESGGKIVGDADQRCGEVAKVFTPVPRGVGPITVAMIFKNLCVLRRERISS